MLEPFSAFFSPALRLCIFIRNLRRWRKEEKKGPAPETAAMKGGSEKEICHEGGRWSSSPLFSLSSVRLLARSSSLFRPQSMAMPERELSPRDRAEISNCEAGEKQLRSGANILLAQRQRRPLSNADDANDDDEKLNLFPKKQNSFNTNNSVMLVGWGGNNGTTVTAGILANKL